jgi:YidC/Oxa1 family membrane protein insertase
MDIQRFFLFLIFTFSLLLVWDGWQRHQHPEQYLSSNIQTEKTATTALPQEQNRNTIKQQGKFISVKTDTVEAKISTIGGNIVYLALLEHPDSKDITKPAVLFNTGAGTHNYSAQSGLLGNGLPNHNSAFIAEQDHYELNNDARLQIKLKPEVSAPLNVIKTLTFEKGSYLIDVSYELENTGSQPIEISSYYQLTRDAIAPEGGSKFLPTYTGAAIFTEEEKFKKLSFSDIEKGKEEYQKQAQNGWIGMLQHYFVSAWIPKERTAREYFTRKLDEEIYSAGVVLPDVTVKPNEKINQGTKLYVGPTETNLDKIAPGLGLTVDYGWLTVLATPLFWTMSLFHSWTNNWGIAIILLTVLIKLIFFPLSAASYLSMAKMRLVAPKLEKLKLQYADNREQLTRAMMELYKTEKINPLGGCLPVLVQIPVFIALYWSILASVEMRYAPFFGWIKDLSAPDPYYILPVIMGISMIIQSRLNPSPPDPLQAKIMQAMPIVFSVMFFFFPAGLVLYSIVNNILSIAQQWTITRSTQAQSKGAGH